MKRVAWIGLALATACRTGGGAHPVQEVAIEGNKTYGDGSIVDHLQTQPPHGWLVHSQTEFDPVALQIDRKRVEAFYHERGFFDAKVTDVNIVHKPDGAVNITITVEEGAPTQVAEIQIDGTKRDFAEKAIRKAEIPLEKGKRFDHPDYLLAKDALQRALVKEGYAHAVVKGVVEVNRDAKQAIIRLDADPGPMAKFGTVRVEGLKTVPESAVMNRIAWTEGEKFDPELLDSTEGRLYQLGLFSAVKADFTHEGRPPVVDVVVHVSEGTKHELRLGAGVGADTYRFDVHQRSEYTIRDLLGPLTTLRLQLIPGWAVLRTDPYTSGPSIEASAQLEKNDFIAPNLTGQAMTSFVREPRQGYTLTGPRVQLGIEYPIFLPDLHLHAGWEIRYLIFNDYDPTVFGAEATESWLAYYQQRLSFDKRDKPLDAHEGVYAEIEVLEGGPAAGGQVGFVRLVPELRGYLPFLPRFVLAARAKWGRLWTGKDLVDAPVPIRFYGGGANDNRGFGYERLSPQRTDMTGVLIPIGGEEEVLGSLELRFDMVRLYKHWLTLATFYDTGDVTAPGDLDLGNLHQAVGLGLRYDTLIGPVRVDVGYRLNRLGPMDPDPGSRIAFHLSLGEAF